MSIILMIFGVFMFVGLLMAAIAAVTLWVIAAASALAFMVGGYATVALFHTSRDGFYLGGAVAVLILWGALAYMGNRIDKPDSNK